jgi:hypothetical protein
MKTLLTVAILTVLGSASAMAQTASSNAGANPATGYPIPGAMQSLGNIIRNPSTPPPRQPSQVTGQPLGLPTSIPPNTVGSSP